MISFRWHRNYLVATLLLYIFAVAACTTIDLSQEPPADWPRLHMDIQLNVPKLVQTHCPGFGVFGCAVAEFGTGRCRIMMSTYSQSDLDAELSHKHCLGYDHVGESTMRDAWHDYKQSGGSVYAEQELAR